MAHSDAAIREVEQKSLPGSVFKSVFTHYWMFTVYVLGYMTVGMALAAVQYGWSWTVWGLAAATIWFGLEGLHAVDLADDDIAVDVDSNVQTVVGYLEVFFGGLLGIVLAAVTTWWFLGFVILGTALGVAYNEEMFGGLLHDHDKVTGIANFGFSWAVIPFLGAYFVVAETLSLGIVIVSLGVMFDAMRLIWLFEVSKPAPYDDVGIEHDREFNPAPSALVGDVHRANTLNMVAWAVVAIGLVVEFAL